MQESDFQLHHEKFTLFKSRTANWENEIKKLKRKSMVVEVNRECTENYVNFGSWSWLRENKWARKKRSNFNSTIIIRANVVSKSFISELIMIFIASSIECIWWVWLLNLSSFHFHRCHIIAKCSIFSHTVARLLPCTWNKRI